MKELLRTTHAVPFTCALFAFLVYLATLSRSVSFIDAGELATASYTLGIAHPTGYPLFTMLGWVFARLPVAHEVVVRLNIMAAFFCAAGIFLFVHLVRFILRRAGSKSGVPRAPVSFEGTILAASAGAGLLLSFSETYWSQAVAVEVYSLHLLFLSSVSLLFLKASFDWRTEGERWWYGFAFVLGSELYQSHDHDPARSRFSVFLFCPAGLEHAVPPEDRPDGSPFRGRSLCLPVSSSPRRAVSCDELGESGHLERFLWHFSGKQYRVWIFSSTEAASRQFRYFIDSLPAEFAYVGLALALPGIIVLWRSHRKLAVATLLLFAACVGYSINYDIHDIDSYFLLAYVTMGIWAGLGLAWLIPQLAGILPGRMASAVALALLLSLAPLFLHFGKSDESSDYLVEDYTRNMFSSLRPNAMILSYQWDYWVSAAHYYQLVDGERPDAVVIDKELLRRSWYLGELRHRYPWLIAESQAEVDAFLKEVDKFEHDLPYNPSVIEGRYAAMIDSFIRKNIGSHPVYVTGEIEGQYTRGYQRVPAGLAFRLFADTLVHTEPMPGFSVRPCPRSGRLEDFTRRLYADAYAARGEYYYYRVRDVLEAKADFRLALAYDPTSPLPRRWLKSLGGAE